MSLSLPLFCFSIIFFLGLYSFLLLQASYVSKPFHVFWALLYTKIILSSSVCLWCLASSNIWVVYRPTCTVCFDNYSLSIRLFFAITLLTLFFCWYICAADKRKITKPTPTRWKTEECVCKYVCKEVQVRVNYHEGKKKLFCLEVHYILLYLYYCTGLIFGVVAVKCITVCHKNRSSNIFFLLPFFPCLPIIFPGVNQVSFFIEINTATAWITGTLKVVNSLYEISPHMCVRHNISGNLRRACTSSYYYYVHIALTPVLNIIIKSTWPLLLSKSSSKRLWVQSKLVGIRYTFFVLCSTCAMCTQFGEWKNRVNDGDDK